MTRLALRFLAVLSIGLTPSWAEDRPNLVFLLADDLTSYAVGCYGNADVKTPHIDSLAKDGMQFNHHYDTTAICMASRANIFTGLVEYRNGCNFEHGHLPQATWEQSYPLMLKEAGYRIGFAGKFGLEISEEAGGKKGTLPEGDFDAWGGGPGQTHYSTAKNASMKQYAEDYPHSSVSYGAFGRDFIAESAQDEAPFCLSISFKAPHMPDTPDPQFDHVYEGVSFTKPKNYGREHGSHFSKQSQQGRQYERFHSWGYSDNYDEVMRKYHQLVYGIDQAVGMIRKALEDEGVADNTVVIFTSDNGFFCGAHGYGSKVLPYEESAKVPLLVFDPRHASAGEQRSTEALTGNVDMAATLLDLAGLDVPEHWDGRSVMPLLDDPSATIHESLPLINVWGPKEVHSFGVVTKDWKYIYWPYAGEGFEATEELYEVAYDPLELTNRIEDGSAPTEAMRKLYDKHVTRWQEQAVDFNNYQPFGKLFDRHLPWEDRKLK